MTPMLPLAVTAVAGVLAVGAPTTTPSEPSTGHVVEHAMGETVVPANPERIVVLDSSFLDAAVALGVYPVGATEGFAGGGLPSYLPDEVHTDVAVVGETNTPNLEAVAELDPDLIIGAQVRHEAIYEQLSAIAPTVFSETSGGDWTEQVLITGAALDREADARRLLDEFDARAAEIGEQLGAGEMTATIVRFLPGETRLYGPGTFSGSVLTAVGFDLGDKGYAEYSMAMISSEQVELIEADVVFTTTWGTEETDRSEFEALWSTLDVVQNEMVFDVEDDIWMLGIGVLGAHLILDDLVDLLG